MKIVSIKNASKTQPNLFKATMDDDKVFMLHADAILEYNIIVGEQLNEKDFFAALQKSEWLIACACAVNFLSRQLKTTKQLTNYLTKKQYSPDTIERLVAKMKDYNLISDEQYAKSYTTSMQKSKSKMFVKNKLMQAGVDKDIINDNLQEYDEKQSCAHEVEKFFKNNPVEKKYIDKLIRHLQYKGYAWESISFCLKSYQEDICE